MQIKLKDIFLDLLLALKIFPAFRYLPSIIESKSLCKDPSKLIQIVDANDFDIRQIIPLLQAVYIKESDYVIWDKVYIVVAEYTSPRLPTIPPYSYPTFPSYIKDTPSHFNSGKLQNTSEPVKKVGRVLKFELNSNLELDYIEFDIIYLAIL